MDRTLRELVLRLHNKREVWSVITTSFTEQGEGPGGWTRTWLLLLDLLMVGNRTAQDFVNAVFCGSHVQFYICDGSASIHDPRDKGLTGVITRAQWQQPQEVPRYTQPLDTRTQTHRHTQNDAHVHTPSASTQHNTPKTPRQRPLHKKHSRYSRSTLAGPTAVTATCST